MKKFRTFFLKLLFPTLYKRIMGVTAYWLTLRLLRVRDIKDEYVNNRLRDFETAIWYLEEYIR